MRAITTRRQERLSELLQEELKRRDREALEALLGCREGRWFLMRLFDRCRLNAEVFTGNSATFRNEGMRKVAIMYQEDIAALGLDAVKLKQQAELEYIEAQAGVAELFMRDGEEREE